MTYLNQRVPDINLSNLEDFLEAVEASTDEEKEEPDEPNIAEGASGAMFDSLPKVQAETPKKGRSRHVVDNLNFFISRKLKIIKVRILLKPNPIPRL